MKIPRTILENAVDIKDLEILNRLTDTKFFDSVESQITREIAKSCSLSIHESRMRIKSLKEKGIIRGFGALVDRLQLWDNMIFTFIKVALSPPLIDESVVDKYPSTWVKIGQLLQEFVNEDKTANKILREAYTLIGTEWDLLIITVTNDLNEHREMFERLSRKGFISRAASMFPIQGAPYIYRPISSPPVDEVRNSLKELKEYLEKG